jgi:hypothetical protein
LNGRAFRSHQIEKFESFTMTRRERWRRVLDRELQRWSAMTPERLASAPDEERVYEVELDSKTYQVEVEILENTEDYLHVLVAVDDGSLPASMAPEAQSFICQKKVRSI